VDCACIKANYNFQLKALDSKTLLYQDFSDWMEHDYYERPEKYTVEVTPPNSNKSVKLEIKTNGLNVITSKELGFGENSCLPQGVFSFMAKSCGNTYVRYKGVTPDLECRVECALLQGVDPLEISRLTTKIKSIHYNLERDMITEANKIFKVVTKEIDLLECDCGCC